MRSLEDFVAATPLNTIGMGNISTTQIGSDVILSEPICDTVSKRRKRLYDYVMTM